MDTYQEEIERFREELRQVGASSKAKFIDLKECLKQRAAARKKLEGEIEWRRSLDNGLRKLKRPS